VWSMPHLAGRMEDYSKTRPLHASFRQATTLFGEMGAHSCGEVLIGSLREVEDWVPEAVVYTKGRSNVGRPVDRHGGVCVGEDVLP
jgi:hypothetical protein